MEAFVLATSADRSHLARSSQPGCMAIHHGYLHHTYLHHAYPCHGDPHHFCLVNALCLQLFNCSYSTCAFVVIALVHALHDRYVVGVISSKSLCHLTHSALFSGSCCSSSGILLQLALLTHRPLTQVGLLVFPLGCKAMLSTTRPVAMSGLEPVVM